MHNVKDTIIKQQENQLPISKDTNPKIFVLLISVEVLHSSNLLNRKM